MSDPKIYADYGINWEFIYEVEYEDECILILKYLGRYHRYDTERMFTRQIDKYIDMPILGSDYVRIDGVLKLIEVK